MLMEFKQSYDDVTLVVYEWNKTGPNSMTLKKKTGREIEDFKSIVTWPMWNYETEKAVAS